MTTYYITKYALTKGVYTVDVEPPTGNKDYVWDGFNVFALGIDAHVEASAAWKRAEEMRITRIASLKKQIAKLEKLKF